LVSDLPGYYEKTPVTNNWHRVTVTLDNGVLWWTNAAGVRWVLTLNNGVLMTGADCPYGVREVQVEKLPGSYVVSGLRFLDELYQRM
jgi:hypothetical protein